MRCSRSQPPSDWRDRPYRRSSTNPPKQANGSAPASWSAPTMTIQPATVAENCRTPGRWRPGRDGGRLVANERARAPVSRSSRRGAGRSTRPPARRCGAGGDGSVRPCPRSCVRHPGGRPVRAPGCSTRRQDGAGPRAGRPLPGYGARPTRMLPLTVSRFSGAPPPLIVPSSLRRVPSPIFSNGEVADTEIPPLTHRAETVAFAASGSFSSMLPLVVSALMPSVAEAGQAQLDGPVGRAGDDGAAKAACPRCCRWWSRP